jgi:hypothetical protein
MSRAELKKITAQIIMWIVVKGLFDNVLSDYLWARAVILTSPTVPLQPTTTAHTHAHGSMRTVHVYYAQCTMRSVLCAVYTMRSVLCAVYYIVLVQLVHM